MLETDVQHFDAFEAETKKLVEQNQPFRTQFGARWAHEARSAKPQRNWLVKNLLLAKTFGIVFGPPGCGKSFLVSDLCLTMTASVLDDGEQKPSWFGYSGRPFGVVYVVAEGADDFEIRLHAWMQEHDVPEGAVLPFVYLPTNVDMRSNDEQAKKLIEEIKGVSAEMMERCGVPVEMVVIDTVARALNGGNENASEVMAAFVTNCGLVQQECGVAVLGVHHGGKEAGRGPRGHEGLHGAADFEFEVIGATEDTPNNWTVRKLKSGPGGASHRFRLRQTVVGNDEDGDPITSCIVNSNLTEAEKAGGKPQGYRPSRLQREFLNVLGTVVDRNGQMPPPDLGLPGQILLVANVEDVKREYVAQYHATETGTEQEVRERLARRWSQATKELITRRLVGSVKPWIFFTGREIQGVRIKGVALPENPPTAVDPAPQAQDPPLDDPMSIDLSNF